MTTSRAHPKANVLNFAVPIAVIILAVLGGLFWIKAEIARPTKSPLSGQLKLGSVLPDFKLTPIQGNVIPVSEIHAKVLLVNFWATWCEACMSEMPSLVKLRETFQNRGFEVIGINVDDNPVNIVPKTMKEFKLRFPIFQDLSGELSDLFDVHAIPLTVVMDQQRKVLLVHDGGRDWNSKEVQSQMERWLSQ